MMLEDGTIDDGHIVIIERIAGSSRKNERSDLACRFPGCTWVGRGILPGRAYDHVKHAHAGYRAKLTRRPLVNGKRKAMGPTKPWQVKRPKPSLGDMNGKRPLVPPARSLGMLSMPSQKLGPPLLSAPLTASDGHYHSDGLHAGAGMSSNGMHGGPSSSAMLAPLSLQPAHHTHTRVQLQGLGVARELSLVPLGHGPPPR
jgi:hypothetical protein